MSVALGCLSHDSHSATLCIAHLQTGGTVEQGLTLTGLPDAVEDGMRCLRSERVDELMKATGRLQPRTAPIESRGKGQLTGAAVGFPLFRDRFQLRRLSTSTAPLACFKKMLSEPRIELGFWDRCLVRGSYSV